MGQKKQTTRWRDHVTQQHDADALVQKFNHIAGQFHKLGALPHAHRYMQHHGHSTDLSASLSMYDAERCREARDNGAMQLAEKLVHYLSAVTPSVPHAHEHNPALFAGYDEEVTHRLHAHLQTMREHVHILAEESKARDVMMAHVPQRSVHTEALRESLNETHRISIAPHLRVLDKTVRAMKEDITRMKHMRGTHADQRVTERAILDQHSDTLALFETLFEHSAAASKPAQRHH